MKTKKILIFFSFLFISIGIINSQNAVVPNDVITGFEQGKADLIAEYLNNEVELVIGNTNNVYSKQQAEGVLKDFFLKNRVSSFTILHKGNKGTSTFVVGELKTATGQFRVHLLARESSGSVSIQQIRIDSAD